MSEATRRMKSGAPIAAAILALLALMYWGWTSFYQDRQGPEQPVPFSHRLHVSEKEISCLMCHTTVRTGYRAGIPPLETCMLCHRGIAIHYEPIQKLRDAYYAKKPLVWARVNWVPEFVYFPHSIHLLRGIDCSRCHGDIKLMDRVRAAKKFEMGFCVKCHRENKATHDCFTCHR